MQSRALQVKREGALRNPTDPPLPYTAASCFQENGTLRPWGNLELKRLRQWKVLHFSATSNNATRDPNLDRLTDQGLEKSRLILPRKKSNPNETSRASRARIFETLSICGNFELIVSKSYLAVCRQQPLLRDSGSRVHHLLPLG